MSQLHAGRNVMSDNAARNLLGGVLAMQRDLVAEKDLLAAISIWMEDQSQPLVQILVEQGALTEETRAQLARAVEQHLELRSSSDPAMASTMGRPGEAVKQPGDELAESTLAHGPALQVGASKPAGSVLVGDPTSRGGRFQILRPLAKGGLGQVSVARDNELNREVALKEIQDRHADNPDSRWRFVMEAEITGGLEHPGIVPVYGLGQDGDGRPFYAMRFIKGDSLREAISRYHKRGAAGEFTEQERTMEFRRLLGRFIDVCNTIEYAHVRGVLHRDLKPDNVMLGSYGETLVVDWGLAKAMGKDDPERNSHEPLLQPTAGSGTPTQMGSAVGTPAYMSPEQAAGRLDELGPASDVYSLGATLYTLLTGRPPVSGDNLAEVLRKVQTADFAAPREVNAQIPGTLDAICRRAMALRPADRYASPQHLADDVERFLADESVSAYAEPFTMTTRRWLRKHPKFVASLAASLLIGLSSTLVIAAVVSDRNQQLASANVTLSNANASERAAKGDAELRRQEAESARQKAQRHFDLAMESIETFHTGVSEDALLEQKELADLRAKLLQGPLGFYERMRGDLEGASDEKSRGALAQAYLGIATITLRVGSNPDAVKAFERAAALYEQLVAEFPNVREHRHRLSVCYNNLCSLRTATGHSAEATTAIDRTIELLTQLVAEDAANADYLDHLAGAYNHLGILQGDTGKPLEALRSFRQMIDLIEPLLARLPRDRKYRSMSAVGYLGLGNAQHSTAQPLMAIESYTRSIEIQQQLVDEDDSQIDFQHRLGIGCGNLGALYAERGDRAQALKWLQHSMVVRKRIVDRHPNVTAYQAALAGSYSTLAAVQTDEGQISEALKNFQLAVAIKKRLADQHPHVIEHQGKLASSNYDLGILHGRMQQTAQSQQFYEQAIAISQQLVDEHPGLTESWSLLARSHTNLGVLLGKTRQHAAAHSSLQKAIEIGRKLVAENAIHEKFLVDLAKAYNGIADVHILMGSPVEALASFQQTLDARKELVAQDPEMIEYRTDLAYTYIRIGELQAEAGHPSKAISPYEEAIKIREALAAQHPELGETRSLLASTYVALGQLHGDVGKPSETLRWYKQASTVREKLVAENPDSSDLAVTLGGNYCNIGIVIRESGGALAESEDWLNKAVRTLSAVVMKEEANARARLFLRNSHFARALTLTDVSQFKNAVADWNRAIELDTGNSRAYLRMQRALTTALAKDHASATKEAELLLPEAQFVDLKFIAARIFALAISAAEKDEAIPLEQRKQLGDTYGSRAIELLRELRKMGYFKTSTNLDYLKNGADLNSLRNREDYLQMMADLMSELNE